METEFNSDCHTFKGKRCGYGCRRGKLCHLIFHPKANAKDENTDEKIYEAVAVCETDKIHREMYYNRGIPIPK